jgi:hypothetical protein
VIDGRRVFSNSTMPMITIYPTVEAMLEARLRVRFPLAFAVLDAEGDAIEWAASIVERAGRPILYYAKHTARVLRHGRES